MILNLREYKDKEIEEKITDTITQFFSVQTINGIPIPDPVRNPLWYQYMLDRGYIKSSLKLVKKDE